VVGDPVDERLHTTRLYPVIDTSSVAPAVYEASVFQRGQMLGDGWLGDVESCGQVFDGGFAAHERFENGSSAGVSKRLKDSVFARGCDVHAELISIHLLIVKSVKSPRAAARPRTVRLCSRFASYPTTLDR